MWKLFWPLQLPGVLKHFVWKLSNNALPTKENLCRRKIVTDPLCPFCSSTVESAWHAIWACPAAVAVWQEGHRQIQKLALSESDGFELVQQLMEKLDPNILCEALSMARQIWFRRNGFVFGNSFNSPMQVARQAQDALLSFVEANSMEDGET